MEIYNCTYCVYAHINKVNGKIYIGQTKFGNDPNIRWRNGYGYADSNKFWNAIKKYGWDNFEHEIIASNLTSEEANHFEELLIQKFNSMNDLNGYNLRSGGENNIPSESTRKRQSESAKKRFEDPKEREKNRERAKKRFENPEEILKISTGRKGKMTGESHFFFGKHPSKDAMEKRAKTVASDEWKRKMREKNIGAKNPSAKKFNQYSLDGAFIETWECAKDAERALGVLASNISRNANGIRPTAGGYLWYHAEDCEQPDKSKIILSKGTNPK